MAIVGGIAVPHPPLIVAAVGRGDERRIQATIDAYRKATQLLLDRRPDCLVVTSPHAPLFRDGFHVTTDPVLDGTMARFNAPDERIHAEVDVELAGDIVRLANDAGVVAVGSERYRDDMDHGTYVPLYFVREVASCGEGRLPCPIVRIGLSGLPPSAHRELGHVVARAARNLGRRVGVIASGDLSHKLLAEGPYGFAPEGPVFDERIGAIFESGDLDELFRFDEGFCEAAAECGLRSFQIMAGALDGLPVETELLSREGPFGVGYGVATCMVDEPQRNMEDERRGASDDSLHRGTDAAQRDESDGDLHNGAEDGRRDESDDSLHRGTDAGQRDESGACASDGREAVDPYVALARHSVETYVLTGAVAPVPLDAAAELRSRRAGVFVSLHERGELRGCIGTIGPTCDSVAAEVIQNGVSACSRDPRFSPVRPDELDCLEYSVDVLDPAEPIDSPSQLDPSRYGVIVTKGLRRGLLLPNLEGVDTVAAQLSIAKRKAGIDPDDEAVELERFEVVRHTRGGGPRKR